MFAPLFQLSVGNETVKGQIFYKVSLKSWFIPRGKVLVEGLCTNYAEGKGELLCSHRHNMNVNIGSTLGCEIHT